MQPAVAMLMTYSVKLLDFAFLNLFVLFFGQILEPFVEGFSFKVG